MQKTPIELTLIRIFIIVHLIILMVGVLVLEIGELRDDLRQLLWSDMVNEAPLSPQEESHYRGNGEGIELSTMTPADTAASQGTGLTTRRGFPAFCPHRGAPDGPAVPP